MGLLDQLLGPVDLRKQPPIGGKGAQAGNAPVPPSAPSWVQGSLAPGGMAPPPGMVNAQMNMQDQLGQAAASQGVPSSGMQSSAPPGPFQQQPGQLPDKPTQLPDQSVRVKLGKLW